MFFFLQTEKKSQGRVREDLKEREERERFLSFFFPSVFCLSSLTSPSLLFFTQRERERELHTHTQTREKGREREREHAFFPSSFLLLLLVSSSLKRESKKFLFHHLLC